MILDDLVAATQKRLVKEKQQVSQATLVDQAQRLPAGQAEEIYQKFLAPGLHLIGELKQASPSKGQIVTDFPYQQIAAEYEQIGLTAISVLTEPDYFLGDLAYLKNVAQQQSLPVLRKDFIIDDYMIYQAKVAGAKIILLIIAILTPAQLQQYLQLAHRLGLAVLVEAHDEEEIQQALRAGAQMIGVNNRNLKDFSVSFENSLNLRQLVPKTVAFIAESGVQSPADVQKLRKIGVNGVLIGEALMTATNRRAFVQTALAEPTVLGRAMTKIKICGLMTAADAAIINQAKPDYAGVVFAPGRHQVDQAQARAIRMALDPSIPLVGVFVATPVEEILAIAQAGVIQLVQLHGQASEAAVAQIEAAGFPVIEVGLQGEFSSATSTATYRLIDSGQGSGRPLAWDRFSTLKKENLFVAGGLNRANLAQAIQTLSPYAVDISSGSELAGQKNLAIIKELVAIAHRNQE